MFLFSCHLKSTFQQIYLKTFNLSCFILLLPIGNSLPPDIRQHFCIILLLLILHIVYLLNYLPHSSWKKFKTKLFRSTRLFSGLISPLLSYLSCFISYFAVRRLGKLKKQDKRNSTNGGRDHAFQTCAKSLHTLNRTHYSHFLNFNTITRCMVLTVTKCHYFQAYSIINIITVICICNYKYCKRSRKLNRYYHMEPLQITALRKLG